VELICKYVLYNTVKLLPTRVNSMSIRINDVVNENMPSHTHMRKSERKVSFVLSKDLVIMMITPDFE
jgi:hypothetical protein